MNKYQVTGYDQYGNKISHVMRLATANAARAKFLEVHPKSAVKSAITVRDLAKDRIVE